MGAGDADCVARDVATTLPDVLRMRVSGEPPRVRPRAVESRGASISRNFEIWMGRGPHAVSARCAGNTRVRTRCVSREVATTLPDVLRMCVSGERRASGRARRRVARVRTISRNFEIWSLSSFPSSRE